MIEIKFKVERVYQHQMGNMWGAVIVNVSINGGEPEVVNCSVPLHGLEKNVQKYVREWVSSKEIVGKLFTTQMEL